MSTPSTTYALDQISQYLWSVSVAQQNAFNNGSMGMNEGRDLVLMVEGYALNYGIEQSLSGVQGVTNDVYRLCGSMLQQANQVLTGGSGGGVVPTPGGGGASTYFPIVASLISGQISGQTISDLTWKGLTQLSPTMTLNDTQFTYSIDYTYNVVNGSFTFSSYNPQPGDVIGTFGYKAA